MASRGGRDGRRGSALLGQKHYCGACRCHVQPDAVSIRHHEQGARHAVNVRLAQQLARKDELDARRGKDELERVLRDMDREAQAAMRRDVVGPAAAAAEAAVAVAAAAAAGVGSGAGAGGGFARSGPPRFAGTGSNSVPLGGHGHGPRGPPLPPPPPPPPPPMEGSEEEEDTGTPGLYEVRGQSFLMAEHAPRIRLAPGATCEVLTALGGPAHSSSASSSSSVENEQQWRAAVVMGAPREVHVPHTQPPIVLRYFRLRLLPPGVGADGEGDAGRDAGALGGTELEAAVGNLRLRLSAAESEAMWLAAAAARARAEAEAEAEGASDDSAEPHARARTVALDANTGVGGWETVAVIDAEAAEAEAAADRARAADSRRPRKRGRGGDSEGTDELDPSKALDSMAAQRSQRDRLALEGGTGGGGGAVLAPDDDEGFGATDVTAAYASQGSGGRMYKGVRLDSARDGAGAEGEAAGPASHAEAGAGAHASALVAALVVKARRAPANVRRREDDD